MKMKSICMVLAAIVAFTACNKDENDGGGISTEMTSVKVQLFQETPDTRAEGAAIADQTPETPIVLTDGYLYFATANLVTKVVKLVTTPSDPNATPAEVNITTLTTTGETITDVPNDTRFVYLVGNVPSTVTLPTSKSTPVATLKGVKLDIEDMYKNDGSADAVALFGEGNVIPPAVETDPAKADLPVSAVASRIEIGKLVAKPSGNVVSYDLAGIYINNYYSEMSIDGTLTITPTSSLVDHGDDNSKYSSSNYPSSFTGILHDEYSGKSDVSGEVEPGSGAVWAYQVFPFATGQAIPHIVVKLDNVVISSGGVNVPIGTKYLTVKGFKIGSADLTAMDKGYVYKITSIEFDENNLGETAEGGEFSVEVKVTLKPWETEDLTPVLK